MLDVELASLLTFNLPELTLTTPAAALPAADAVLGSMSIIRTINEQMNSVLNFLIIITSKKVSVMIIPWIIIADSSKCWSISAPGNFGEDIFINNPAKLYAGNA